MGVCLSEDFIVVAKYFPPAHFFKFGNRIDSMGLSEKNNTDAGAIRSPVQ